MENSKFSNCYFLVVFLLGGCCTLLLMYNVPKLMNTSTCFSIVQNLEDDSGDSFLKDFTEGDLKDFTDTSAVFVNPIGGLGNLLFQFAAGFAFAQNRSSMFFLCNDSGKSLQVLDEFSIRAPRRFCNLNAIRHKPSFRWVTEEKLYEKNLITARFVQLGDYFESEIFFKDYKKELRAQLAMPKMIKDEFISQVATTIRSATNSVAVHIRRGDFLKSNPFLSLPITYQINAMKSLITKLVEPTFFVFTDDVKFVKEQFESAFQDKKVKPKVVYVSDNLSKTNVHDFYLMRLCKYFIIANSTFSWWAAYLSDAIVVIAPKPRYDPMYYMSMWDNDKIRDWKRKLYGEFAYPDHWTTMDPFIGQPDYYIKLLIQEEQPKQQ